jgi:glutathione synthase
MKSLFLIEKIGYPGKSDSNSLVAESVKRRYETFCCRKEGLFVKDGKAFAKSYKAYINDQGELNESDDFEILQLDSDIICSIRINPPFDSSYLTSMHILNIAKQNGARVINDPEAIITSPEKIFPKSLMKYMPKTLITSDYDLVKEFWKENKDVIIKPLYEFAGRSVFRLNQGDENYQSVFQLLQEKYSEQIMVQKYIPEVKKGDKRILILNGEFVGCFNRIAPEGQLQSAFARGGSVSGSELTKTEQEIVADLIPILQENGTFFCGLDTIGDKLTEINNTCPAFNPMEKIYGIKIEEKYWDEVERS